MTENIYKNAFNAYNEVLDELNTKYKFVLSSRKMDLSAINLSDEEKMFILKYLGTKKDIGTADAGDFENVLDLIFENKTELTEELNNLQLSIQDKKLKKKVKELLYIVFDKANIDAHINQSQISNKELAKNWQYPLSGRAQKNSTVLRSIYNKRKFLFKKSINESYLPTREVEQQSKYGYDELTLSELQAFFIPSNFYTLNEDQVQELCQALVNSYCKEMGVPTCKVDFENLPVTNGMIVYGEYLVNEGYISLNRKFLSGLKSAKKGNNAVFPLQLASTLIHETQHRVQFANLDKASTSAREELVKQSILHPNCLDYLQLQEMRKAKSSLYAKYLSEPEEIDARDTAMSFVKSMLRNPALTDSEDFEKIASFYNFTAAKEANNEKLNYKPEYSQMFDHIYRPEHVPVDLERSRAIETDHEYIQFKDCLRASSIYDFIESEPVLR